MMANYLGFGLRIASEVPVPGALPADVTGQPQLHIQYGSAEQDAMTAARGPYTLGPDGLLFHKRQVAHYMVDLAAETLTVHPQETAEVSEVSAYLVATALPAVLWMRGELMLHSAAALLPGTKPAVALLGSSGSGKSTVLKALLAQGASAVAEDSSCVRMRDGAYHVSGLPGCLWMRAPGDTLHSPRARLDLPPGSCRTEAPLGALVVLSTEEGQPGIRRLSVVDGLAALLRHRHRAAVPALLGKHAALVPRWAELARQVPVYSLNSQELVQGSAVRLLHDVAGG